ncbi:hypothetical protein [Variovorax sp. Sphag1AA]|uniref:hypothetical protein n=1 Tax=Variovorax sp. Sphag1AA TaxID=2587027 RepID=UPI00160F3BC0|nr:hypothetical protein [Variovorax sp. Sphag1AA]MBB3176026.1 hypothetical protein [Variovorax sp. Sphag1AA]
MERLNGSPRFFIPDIGWQCRRGTRRLYRRLGLDGLLILVGLFLAVIVIARLAHARHALSDARGLLATQPVAEVARTTAHALTNLEKFEGVLPAHDGIPDVVSHLLELAIEEQLVLSRGEYRAQADEIGRFMRYRMTMPVKGRAPSLQRFIERALADQRSLVFESVQFKRDRIQSEQVEAVVQWTLVTGLPETKSLDVASTSP